jgi:hypothetical protein
VLRARSAALLAVAPHVLIFISLAGFTYLFLIGSR